MSLFSSHPSPAHNELLTERQVAQLLQIKAATLRKWRWEGRGPSYLKLAGSAVRYRRRDVDRFIAETAVEPCAPSENLK
jgi:predicted DNA-binding transcriptional regulator AlpA